MHIERSGLGAVMPRPGCGGDVPADRIGRMPERESPVSGVMTNALRLIFLGASLLGGVACAAAQRGDSPVSREHRAALDAYRTAVVRAHLDAKPEDIVRPL